MNRQAEKNVVLGSGRLHVLGFYALLFLLLLTDGNDAASSAAPAQRSDDPSYESDLVTKDDHPGDPVTVAPPSAGASTKPQDGLPLLRRRSRHLQSSSNVTEDDEGNYEVTLPGSHARIIGGSEPDEGRYPYLCALFRSDGTFMCGGSLIERRWVLTAAHCAEAANWVVIGLHHMRFDFDYEQHSIAQKIRHPNYNPINQDRDFALLQLAGESSYSPVRLNFDVTVPRENDSLHVVGWGKTERGLVSTVPLEADVQIMSNRRCRYSCGAAVTSYMVCAANSAGNKDSCQGDSGGPLVFRSGLNGGDASSDVVHAVVSWGKGCADSRYPGVYARVAEVMSWIQGYTGITDSGGVPGPVPSLPQGQTPTPPQPTVAVPVPVPAAPAPPEPPVCRQVCRTCFWIWRCCEEQCD